MQIEGNRFNRNISHSEIIKIGNAQSRTDVGSIWGRIVDWFAGSNKEAAKSALFDLLHADVTDEVKLSSFNRLQQAAATAYRSRFDYQVMSVDTVRISIPETGLNMNLSVPGGIPLDTMNFILEGYGEDTTETRMNVLRRDVPRANYHIGDVDTFSVGDAVPDDTKVEAVENFANANVNEYQRRMLGTVATQSSTIALKNVALQQDNRFIPIGNNHLQEFTMRKLISGDIQVDVHYRNTVPPHLRDFAAEENAHTYTELNATFIIGQEHTHCIRAKFSGSSDQKT
ncbi:hypothetical protein [Burkholderia sp. BE17]|uniref:hypothetical protein n=1 Tax=Burkholderia sp. BE17 TaxID=2656644 RepID=UPI00128DDAF5|nr:hypothetical protein [Burkholderia sp. BE17]MPV70222.1 hypothetical protein [Burkholderia sp. BE17]